MSKGNVSCNPIVTVKIRSSNGLYIDTYDPYVRNKGFKSYFPDWLFPLSAHRFAWMHEALTTGLRGDKSSRCCENGRRTRLARGLESFSCSFARPLARSLLCSTFMRAHTLYIHIRALAASRNFLLLYLAKREKRARERRWQCVYVGTCAYNTILARNSTWRRRVPVRAAKRGWLWFVSSWKISIQRLPKQLLYTKIYLFGNSCIIFKIVTITCHELFLL